MSLAYMAQDNEERLIEMIEQWHKFEPSALKKVGERSYSFKVDKREVRIDLISIGVRLEDILLGVLQACRERNLTLAIVPLTGAKGTLHARLERNRIVLATSVCSNHPGYAALDAYTSYLWRIDRNKNYDSDNDL